MISTFMWSDSKKKNIDYYSSLLEKYGGCVQALNWRDEKSQELRFKVFTEIGELKERKILDVGCGLGDYYGYLRMRGIPVDYKGIDITPKMIELSKRRFPEAKFEIKDILVEEENEKYDYVFASGVFYLVEEEPFEFMKKMVERMFRLSSIGIAFNSLSGWASYKEDKEFYADPIEVLKFCKTLTKKIVFRHDYHMADFTIFLYK